MPAHADTIRVGFQSGGMDTVNGKLLVATENQANGSRPAVFRCNLDGTSCTYTDVSAGAGVGSGSDPSLGIDTTNGKLLIATRPRCTRTHRVSRPCDYW